MDGLRELAEWAPKLPYLNASSQKSPLEFAVKESSGGLLLLFALVFFLSSCDRLSGTAVNHNPFSVGRGIPHDFHSFFGNLSRRRMDRRIFFTHRPSPYTSLGCRNPAAPLCKTKGCLGRDPSRKGLRPVIIHAKRSKEETHRGNRFDRSVFPDGTSAKIAARMNRACETLIYPRKGTRAR
jgi:hypothetical protein